MQNKYNFVVSEAEYKDAGSPRCSDTITDSEFDILYYADMRYRAKLKALRVLSYADNSERQLMRKLLSLDIMREIAEETVAEMKRLGYLDSLRQIKRVIDLEVNGKLVGKRKLIPKLLSKGYTKSDVFIAIDEMQQSGELDFDAVRERFISERCEGLSELEVKKMLYKNGYYVC